MNFSIEGVLTDKKYQVMMDDGSVWQIPVILIALDRANYYAGIDKIALNESLMNDTVPLFEADDDEIEDWAKNNMDWKDVVGSAIMIEGPDGCDHYNGWINGDVTVV